MKLTQLNEATYSGASNKFIGTSVVTLTDSEGWVINAWVFPSRDHAKEFVNHIEETFGHDHFSQAQEPFSITTADDPKGFVKEQLENIE